jgi:hypothetical protein
VSNELTQVSASSHFHGSDPTACGKRHDQDITDPVILALERDSAWELMNYHQREAAKAKDEQQKASRRAKMLSIDSYALTRIDRFIKQHDAGWEKSTDPLARIREIITEARSDVADVEAKRKEMDAS